MNARIRYVTRRPNGRETTRTVEAAGPTFIVGRGSGSAVHLPDLRVALTHARIAQTSPETLRIEAEGDSRFKHKGRLVAQADVALAPGAATTIGIGPFELAFSLVEGQLDIHVSRPASASAAKAKIDPDEAFSLKGTWLSKRVSAWILAVSIALIGLAFPVAVWSLRGPEADAPVSAAAMQAGSLWLSGVTSHAHSATAADCESCHVKPFQSVSDDTCAGCHAEVRHHADPERMAAATPPAGPFSAGLTLAAAAFGKPPERCTSCHVEHDGVNGAEPARQALCADCHAALDARIKDASVLNARDFRKAHPEFRPTLSVGVSASGPIFAARWSITELDAARKAREAAAPPEKTAESCDGFDVGRANFRGLAQPPKVAGSPADNSGLVFPHGVHLDEDGCVAAIGARLGPKAGYGDDGLDCADCHEVEEGGALFRPVDMETHCAACHSLTFETVNGVDRELRHGEPVDVIAGMLDFYQARAATATLQPAALSERRRPGEAGAAPQARSPLAVFTTANTIAAQRVREIFSRGGACYGCHEIVPPSAPGALDYGIAPLAVRDRFLPRGVFDHSAHENVACADCHAAETSRTAADVLLPSIASCQTCHGGEHAASGVPSTCVACHGFHAEDSGLPLMRPAALTTASSAKGAPP